MMGTNIPRETVTKQCKQCDNLFKADIDGTGRCLDEFCSVRCENAWATETRRMSPDVVNESYCSVCAETHETKWNGRTSTAMGRKMWSSFLRHVGHIHCEDDEYPIDLDDEEHPRLFVYRIDKEEWKEYDDEDKYWYTVDEADVPDAILADHEENN